jgi:hypothetical protein
MGGGFVCAFAAAASLAGCGRIGFDPLGDGTGGGGADSDGGAGSSDSTGSTETLTLPAVADTALNSFAPTLNYGTGTSFNVRGDMVSTFTGLVAFDLSTVSGAITSATLRLRTGTMALSTGSIEVVAVLEAWDEGSQNGGAGAASYTMRQGSTPWLTPGCGLLSRASTSAAQLAPTAANTSYDIELPPDIVQGWVNDPATNHGFVLAAVGTGNGTVTFASRESGTPPQLVIDVAH